jgi:hypothetical protein
VIKWSVREASHSFSNADVENAWHFTSTYLHALISYVHEHLCEPGSSVSMVCGYRLDYRAIEVRSLAEAKGFFL